MPAKSQRIAHQMLFKRENSMFTGLAHHPYFENWALIIIILNAMWMGVDVETSDPDDREQQRM